MQTLKYDSDVFDEGNGWIYRKAMAVTIPGLLLAALEMGLINAGVLSESRVPALNATSPDGLATCSRKKSDTNRWVTART